MTINRRMKEGGKQINRNAGREGEMERMMEGKKK